MTEAKNTKYTGDHYIVYLHNMGPRRVFIPAKDLESVMGVRHDVLRLLPGLNVVKGEDMRKASDEFEEMESKELINVYDDAAWLRQSASRKEICVSGERVMPYHKSRPTSASKTALRHILSIEKSPETSALIEQMLKKIERPSQGNVINYQ